MAFDPTEHVDMDLSATLFDKDIAKCVEIVRLYAGSMHELILVAL